MYRTVLLAGLLLLAGCASQVPAPIRQGPERAPELGEVRADPDRYVSVAVRWGGNIVETRNDVDETWIEVVARPLDREGRPRAGDLTQGRFLVRVKGFLEPTVYAPGRELTVMGRLAEPHPGRIGRFPYTYPVVTAEHVYLWPERRPVPDYYRDPFWYDPWYPFYYPYPYWRYRP